MKHIEAELLVFHHSREVISTAWLLIVSAHIKKNSLSNFGNLPIFPSNYVPQISLNKNVKPTAEFDMRHHRLMSPTRIKSKSLKIHRVVHDTILAKDLSLSPKRVSSASKIIKNHQLALALHPPLSSPWLCWPTVCHQSVWQVGHVSDALPTTSRHESGVWEWEMFPRNTSVSHCFTKYFNIGIYWTSAPGKKHLRTLDLKFRFSC